MQRSGIPPWHMWGNTQTLEVRQSGGSGVGAEVAGQLARISYARPESWHWIFMSELLSAPDASIPASAATVDVYYDLTIGIGRSMIQIPAFEHHQWQWANGTHPAAPIGERLYTTTVPGNRLSNYSLNPAVSDPTIISEFVAQDVQLNCRLVLTTTGNGFTARASVSAQFSPKTHIRPEWHEKRFPGAENGGGTGDTVRGGVVLPPARIFR